MTGSRHRIPETRNFVIELPEAGAGSEDQLRLGVDLPI